jgi:hypothetical protein
LPRSPAIELYVNRYIRELWTVLPEGLKKEHAEIQARLEAGKTAASPEGRAGVPVTFVPTKADLTILTVLAKVGGRALENSELIAEGIKLTRRPDRRPDLDPVSETILRERLRLLIKGGYVARPLNAEGKPTRRKGVGITDPGRELLKAAGLNG